MPKVTKDTVQPSTKNIQPLMAQKQNLIYDLVVAPKPKPTIPYSSRVNKQKLQEKDDNLALKFVEIFRNLHFELSFVDAFMHMPKFALMFKSLLNNKDKLFDLATTPVNKNCSAIILKKLPEILGDPGKFLIPCDFLKFSECLALADLGVSINLMPLSIWKKICLPELTSTQMILVLADRSTTRPAGIAEEIFVKVEKTRRALIDVYGKELTLRVDDEAITFKVGQTLKYSYNDAESINRINVINIASGSKDRPPMLAPGNYIQWKSRIKRYIDTKPNREIIHYYLEHPPYELGWKEKFVLDAEGNPITATKKVFETYKNVKQEIRDQLNAEAEAVQIILTGIDNDIYSIVDACPNACEMWKDIERLKQGESINVQDLQTNLFWEFGKFTSLDGESLESYYSRFYKMMNELTRNQCKVTNH
uniref:Reverse transcriptase domain-containing protein n=1 Tax=Tanacetum cinerariifolium TaxID=118510 RepID=A0A699KA93_TANCI|nr:reverse transcriptase domain-containing protein [Tanacetum cinerariifolium]